MSVKALAGQLSCDFTQDNTQLLQLSLVGRRILDTSFYSKTTADCSKNVMLHDIKHSQMAQMSLYNSFFQDSVRLPTNVPDQRPLSFPKLALSQNLNGEINYFNKFNSLIQQQPVFQRIQGTSDYSSFPTVEKHNNNDNNKLCLLSDETLSFHNELSSPAKTPVFCKLEDADNCKDNKELPSPTDTKETNENSPLVSDSKQPKITKNILFYKTHFLITSNPNLPKLDLPESEDMIPKIKHDGITKSGIRFEENSTNQNRLRSQIKSLNLFINYSEISTDRSEDSLNLFCEESYNLDDILLKNDSEENVQVCTKEERLAKILKYKNKIRKWRSNHPVNKRFNGRSSVATKKPRIKGKFVTSEKYLEFLELQSPNEQTPCQ